MQGEVFLELESSVHADKRRRCLSTENIELTGGRGVESDDGIFNEGEPIDPPLDCNNNLSEQQCSEESRAA
jgi:hypothetical protein